MTGYGFCGPMTAAGTVFADKGEAPAVDSVATKYRYRYRYQMVVRFLLLCAGGLG